MNEERADEALDHLQTAAREMIEAARAFLDVAEELVADPGSADSVVGFIDSLTSAAGRARHRSSSDEDVPEDPVEHIHVS